MNGFVCAVRLNRKRLVDFRFVSTLLVYPILHSFMIGGLSGCGSMPDGRGQEGSIDSLFVDLVDGAARFNTAPIAEAGDDETVTEGDLVELDGSESFDPDGDPISFSWEQSAGPPVVLADSTKSIASFVAPEIDANVDLVFTLTVFDDPPSDSDSEFESPPARKSRSFGRSHKRIKVENLLEPTSFGPMADAGPAQIVTEGTVVTLDGSDSYGSGKDVLVFSWMQASGPAITLSDPTEAVTTFIAPPFSDVDNKLTFTLTVAEGDLEAFDELTIKVTAYDPDNPDGGGGGNGGDGGSGEDDGSGGTDPENVLPIALAGPDQAVVDNDGDGSELVDLDGSGSNDPDGSIVSWVWLENGQEIGSGVTSSVLFDLGAHLVTLRVTDDGGDSGEDSVQITLTNDSPDLSVSPAELNFGSNATNLMFEVWNSGGDTLDYVIDDNTDWLSVSPTSGQSSGEHDTITATVDRRGLPDGEYEGEIQVEAPSIGVGLSILVKMWIGDGCVPTMATASRTTGVAPLGVFFDAVDTADPAWTSSVIQPRGFDAQPANCTGVRITRVNYHNNLGTGTLTYTHSSTSLTWMAPGDAVGSAVNVSGGGNFDLVSGDDFSTLYVWLDPDNLPASDQSDTITVTDGGENADWNSFHFEWIFGDPGSGNWSNGATRSDGTYPSKNVAFGWNAAHVYESAGIYCATLTITDDVGGTHIFTQAITVSADPPGGWTAYYFADGGDDSNTCSEANPCRSFAEAMTLAGDNVKLLFKRDDEFPVAQVVNPSVSGPLYIGVYGTGNRPRFTIAGTNSFFYGRTLGDARFVDLWVDGDYPNQASPGDGFSRPATNTLILRCRVQDMLSAFSLDRESGVVIQECEGVNSKRYAFWIVTSSQTSVLGCTASDGHDEALLRTYTNKLVVSHCLFERPSWKYSIRFMAGNVNPRNGLWNIISHNKLINVATNPSGDSDTLMPKHMLIDSNDYDWPTQDRGTAINIYGVDSITIRNNRVYTPNAISFVTFSAGYNDHGFHHRNVHIYDNTISTTTTRWVWFFNVEYDVAANASSFVLKNNILRAPNATDAASTFSIRLRDSRASDPLLESDYNCWYVPNVSHIYRDSNDVMDLQTWQTVGQDGYSIDRDPLLDAYLRLRPGSPCIDAGSVEVLPWCRIDADGQPRAAGAINIGAYE